MKLKTRLIIAFLTVILMPVALSVACVAGLVQYQMHSIEKTYGITGASYESLENSMQVMNLLTEESYLELSKVASKNKTKLEDVTFLEEFNEKLEKKSSYLIIRRGSQIVYSGGTLEETQQIEDKLPEVGAHKSTSESGMYFGGEAEVLVKQIDFHYADSTQGSAFIVTDVSDVIPQLRAIFVDSIIAVVLIIALTAGVMILWIYKGVAGPIAKLQVAAQNIKDGNLDFHLESESNDEIGQLCQDFEEMRTRLKDNAEEKLVFDKESKDLISNISHDLKTPLTAIKGYVEGIMDGVADTPEKMDRYIKTIYNKTIDMDRLINELTLYTKIDTNRIPYNFNTLSVKNYFADCAEELSLDLESKGIRFGYSNYVEDDCKIIADAEQLKGVINNIVTNSVKYMDRGRGQGQINLRVKDVGDFIQVEMEDNGKGIAAKDLPNIFDRFYRTDASRNSSQGGSGIGLSIVKKIIEEHGGKIWATSKEGTGTIMYFVVRKYQEVPINE